MAITSFNPATEELIHSYQELTPEAVNLKLNQAYTRYTSWRYSDLDERKKLMLNFANLLREKREYLAAIITQEMGCPISQANTEIEKCAFITEHFCETFEDVLAPNSVNLDARESYISFDPLGVILHIAPWNYPFYLALRPTIPAILAGNTLVLKHASNVPQTSLALEALFLEAGFPEGVFQSLLITSGKVEGLIADPRVSLITLIGSENAGSKVASQAGKYIKKTVMELGGSDPFIVLNDADIDIAVAGATQSRLRNCGQSCNAAKRFIVMEEVAKEFIDKLVQSFEKEVVGNPTDRQTTLGPLATQSSLNDIQKQVEDALQQGATLNTGGQAIKVNGLGYYFQPTILTNVTRHMSVWHEEVFGPVAPVMVVQSVSEAIEVANESRYGLGASIWTRDYDQAKKLIPQLDTGNVYINSIVRGDPRLPFGGVKKSGYGREFSEYGIKEFVNIKSVVIK